MFHFCSSSKQLEFFKHPNNVFIFFFIYSFKYIYFLVFQIFLVILILLRMMSANSVSFLKFFNTLMSLSSVELVDPMATAFFTPFHNHLVSFLCTNILSHRAFSCLCIYFYRYLNGLLL